MGLPLNKEYSSLGSMLGCPLFRASTMSGLKDVGVWDEVLGPGACRAEFCSRTRGWCKKMPKLWRLFSHVYSLRTLARGGAIRKDGNLCRDRSGFPSQEDHPGPLLGAASQMKHTLCNQSLDP